MRLILLALWPILVGWESDDTIASIYLQAAEDCELSTTISRSGDLLYLLVRARYHESSVANLFMPITQIVGIWSLSKLYHYGSGKLIEDARNIPQLT